jgi:hypothetical protein
MDTYTTSALILLAGLIHASFALSVSMLTLMSGHAMGRKAAHTRVLALSAGFVLGVMSMVALLLSFLVLFALSAWPNGTPTLVWSGLSGLMVGVGVVVWTFYYKRGQRARNGTMLWLPRAMATFISKRARQTTSPAESYSLGMVSVIAELLFLIAPLALTSLLIVRLDPGIQLAALLIYTLIAASPLLLITALVGGGRHSLAQLQRWREHNKRFLQFAAGSALIVLGGFLYATMTLGAGGAI